MGCRCAQDALPHATRLNGFLQSGVLRKLVVAESRPLDESEVQRAWVQDKLAEDAEEVGRLLFPSADEAAQKGQMLVCGAGAMGAAVRSVVSEIATSHSGSIAKLEKERRFVTELW